MITASIEKERKNNPSFQYEGPSVEESALAAATEAEATARAAADEDIANGEGPIVPYPDPLVALAIVQHLKQQGAGVSARPKVFAAIPPQNGDKKSTRATANTIISETVAVVSDIPDCSAQESADVTGTKGSENPAPLGWLVANFPVNDTQGKLLEYLLAGSSTELDVELDNLLDGFKFPRGKKSVKAAVDANGNINGASTEEDILIDIPLYRQANIDALLWLRLDSKLEASDSAPVLVSEVFSLDANYGKKSDLVDDKIALQSIDASRSTDASDLENAAIVLKSDTLGARWWNPYMGGFLGSTIGLPSTQSDGQGKAPVVKYALVVETIEIALEAAHDRANKLVREATGRLAARIGATMEYRDALAAVVATNAAKGKGEEKDPDPTVPSLVSDPISTQHADRVASPKPGPFLDATYLERRRHDHRKNLSVSSQMWQALRCGEHRMQYRSLCVPLREWRESSTSYENAMKRCCFDMVELEQNTSAFANETLWKFVCSVRSYRGDLSTHVIAAKREELLKVSGDHVCELNVIDDEV